MVEKMEGASRLPNESLGYLQEHLDGCTHEIELLEKEVAKYRTWKEKIEAELERRKSLGVTE